MLTRDKLLAAGYRPFQDDIKRITLRDWYRESYQKQFVDTPGGIRYIITIAHGFRPGPGIVAEPFFQPFNQYRRADFTFNVEMLWHGESLVEIEQFFAELWTSMRCDYYECTR